MSFYLHVERLSETVAQSALAGSRHEPLAASPQSLVQE